MLAIIAGMSLWQCGLETQGNLKTSLSSVSLMIPLNYLRFIAIYLLKMSIIKT